MRVRNVLIVDDEDALTQSIESGFEPYRDYNILAQELLEIGVNLAMMIDLAGNIIATSKKIIQNRGLSHSGAVLHFRRVTWSPSRTFL
ncbi:MAG: hypothetical protein AB1896_11620 [Thermodesulfobacteriota bacterium]